MLLCKVPSCFSREIPCQLRSQKLAQIVDGQRTLVVNALADPGGAHPARAPPNGRGPMIFYAQNANFPKNFRRSLRSRLTLSVILIEIWPKHANNDYYLDLQHFQ